MSRGLIAAALFAASAAAHAQYPTRPILLVVPYTAGSDADLAARNLAQHASRYLNGQTIVVMNQPGASGAIGTLVVRDAAPDGYRLLLSRIASQVILPATDRKTAYDANDFTFLSVLETNPYVCAVKGDAPFASMKDLVAEIRKRPGKLNFATVGVPYTASQAKKYIAARDESESLLHQGVLLGRFCDRGRKLRGVVLISMS